MPTQTRILLIDGDAQGRAAIAAALAGSNLSHTLDEAENAALGLTTAKREIFDCVLLDSRLAGVDLPDLLAQLTSPDGGRQAVIVLTNGLDSDEVLSLLRAGALDSMRRSDADSRSLARAIRDAKARHRVIFELQTAREEADATSRALARLNRQTTLILSTIAHDLRNPFQVLLGMSELLATTAKASDPNVIVRRAAGVHEAANQAHTLLERLFAWASLHLEARAEPAPVAAAALFDDCARVMRDSADAKGVQIITSATDARVLAQQDAAASILRNLVGNALKFTAAGGRVVLSASARGDRIAIAVEDTGVGMSPQQTANLFQLDRRSTSFGTAGERGAGLGLLLCRDLAEWIGGELEVESTLGVGTTFRLLLPAADNPPPASA